MKTWTIEVKTREEIDGDGSAVQVEVWVWPMFLEIWKDKSSFL